MQICFMSGFMMRNWFRRVMGVECEEALEYQADYFDTLIYQSVACSLNLINPTDQVKTQRSTSG